MICNLAVYPNLPYVQVLLDSLHGGSSLIIKMMKTVNNFFWSEKMLCFLNKIKCF